MGSWFYIPLLNESMTQNATLTIYNLSFHECNPEDQTFPAVHKELAVRLAGLNITHGGCLTFLLYNYTCSGVGFVGELKQGIKLLSLSFTFVY